MSHWRGLWACTRTDHRRGVDPAREEGQEGHVGPCACDGGLRRGRDLAAELDAIALRCAALPLLDDRPEEEILGYDEHGLPA
ncbi:MAG: type II toxin-antitoxin system VapB family antitoxin [Acidimicrobiales bacterium]